MIATGSTIMLPVHWNQTWSDVLCKGLRALEETWHIEMTSQPTDCLNTSVFAFRILVVAFVGPKAAWQIRLLRSPMYRRFLRDGAGRNAATISAPTILLETDDLDASKLWKAEPARQKTGTAPRSDRTAAAIAV